MLVKSRRSQVKRYGCVFTCLAIRAVHIEIAHDHTTDLFIQAFTRFVSRRGSPIEVFSDNGTNFRGAETEIKTALEHWNLDQIDNCLRRRGIRWNFNPPHASHAGAVWERMISSIRKILRSLLGSQIMDDETLLTCMAEVEKILNDRPLTLPRQVILTILSLSLQVNYSSCGQTYVFLLENQTLSTCMEVNAGNKPSIWRTYSGNDGYLSTCRRFKSNRNGSARVQI